MSKIAEQKAIEMFPDIKWTTGGQIHHDGTDYDGRMGFELGYDQAMQDFLEKAERYLKYTLYDRVEIEVYGTLIPSIVNKKEFIDNFKNYMQDESEN